MNLRVPHPSRLLRRVGSDAQMPRSYFLLSYVGLGFIAVPDAVFSGSFLECGSMLLLFRKEKGSRSLVRHFYLRLRYT